MVPISKAPCGPTRRLHTDPTATPPASVEFCIWTISNLCWWLTIADTTNVVTTIKLDEIVCADERVNPKNERKKHNTTDPCAYRIGNGYWSKILMHATTELVKWPKALGYQYRAVYVNTVDFCQSEIHWKTAIRTHAGTTQLCLQCMSL